MVLNAGERIRHTGPEETVVHQDRVGSRFVGSLEQFLASGYSGDDFKDVRTALDLQSVRTEVLELADSE